MGRVTLISFFLFVFAAPSFYAMAQQNTTSKDSTIIVETDSLSSDSTEIEKSLLDKAKINLIYGLKYSRELGAEYLGDPKRIERTVRTIFSKHGKQYGWFPLMSFTSGTRLRLGGGLFVQWNTVRNSIRGLYADSEKYSLEYRATWERYHNNKYHWKFHFSAIRRLDDDMWYYGIGPDPKNDNRNVFLPNTENERGNFLQIKNQILFLAGLRATKQIELYFLTQYEERTIESSDRAYSDDEHLDETFDISQLYGYGGPRSQLYNEIMMRYDNRVTFFYLDVGFSAEYYVGYGQGLHNNRTGFVLSGWDVAGYIPTLKDNWIFQPRLVTNTIVSTGAENDILFYNYPRHQTFRGVSKRYLLRNDEWVMVPSVEHFIPLNKRISFSLFTDLLFVAPEDFKSVIQLEHAPWASGLTFIFHHKNKEFARTHFVIGSEGFRVSAQLGVYDLNDRWRWQ